MKISFKFGENVMQFLRKFHSFVKNLHSVFKKISFNFEKNFTQFSKKFHMYNIQSQVRNNKPQMDHKSVTNTSYMCHE